MSAGALGSDRVPDAASPGVPTPAPAIHIEAGLVASRLGLSVDDFRQLMAAGRIAVLCERGIGEDEGHFRATFYYGDRRARLVVDAEGRPVAAAHAGPGA